MSLRQFQAGAGESTHYGPHGYVQHLRHFAVGKPFDVRQKNRFAHGLRQCVNTFDNLACQHLALYVLLAIKDSVLCASTKPWL